MKPPKTTMYSTTSAPATFATPASGRAAPSAVATSDAQTLRPTIALAKSYAHDSQI
jgi:hypothetical protein